jgi:hypothetical protein
VDSNFAIFGVLSWKLWPKERSWIKFMIWFLTIKTYEHGLNDFWSRCATCHWKDLVKNYNFVMWNFRIKINMEILWPHKIMGFITWEFKNCTWELQGFKPFWCNLHHQSKNVFITRKGGGLFPNMGHVNVMSWKQVCN